MHGPPHVLAGASRGDGLGGGLQPACFSGKVGSSPPRPTRRGSPARRQHYWQVLTPKAVSERCSLMRLMSLLWLDFDFAATYQ